MGDGGRDPATQNAPRSLAAAFAALPSPNTPLVTPAAGRPLLEDGPFGYRLAEAEGIVPAQPEPAQMQPLTTPPVKDNIDSSPDMNMICGGALAPTPVNLPAKLFIKTRPGLQLPSFDMLGIAAPHPDRYGIGVTDDLAANMISLASPQAIAKATTTPESLDLDVGAGLDTTAGASKMETPTFPSPENIPRPAILSPTHQYRDPLTPPEDPLGIQWGHGAPVSHAAHRGDVPSTSPAPRQQGEAVAQSSAAGPTTFRQSLPEGPRTWYQGALRSLVENIRTAPQSKDSLRILSQALPSPSPDGHIFSTIIAAIQGTSPVESWINVFHAIPGRFNLADLPRSPPTTPGPAVGGTDYFTEKIFDSAVPIADYQEDLSQLPRSPRAVVPPASIDVSIVERYIPPTSTNEFDTMFELNGQSILIDRLKEISPNNGSLLLIYPTKAGATTFMREYLSPVLDPTLRSMGVVHGLSASLAGTLGGMASVNRLPSHSDYEYRIKSLLARISQGGPGIDRAFEPRRSPAFSLTYAEPQYLQLSRNTWAQDWWTKQEKPRIREAVARYAREAQMRSSNVHVERPRTSTELLHELLKGVSERPYPEGQEPASGIEVSVFVIRRTA